MPIIKSAKKAARQADKRTKHNSEIKKSIKAAIKAFKKSPSMKSLAAAQSELDKAVKKNLLKKNTAARRKAKLYQIAKTAGLKLEKLGKAVATAADKGAKKSTTKSTTKKPTAKKSTSKPAAAKKPATKKS